MWQGFCMTCSYFGLEVNGMWVLYWYVLVWGQQSIRWKFCYVRMIKNNQSSYLIQVCSDWKGYQFALCTIEFTWHTVKVMQRPAGMVGISSMYPAETCLLTPPIFHYISWFLVTPLFNYILTYLHSLLQVCNYCKLEWLQTFEQSKNINITDMLDCKTLWHWL